MKRKAIIIFLLLSYFTVSSFAQQKNIDVTYVGNSGFLIEIGDNKILIDALFKGFKGAYNLPQEIQSKLSLAQAPFNDVDLILVTHAHGDHINPDMVRQHMQNNPKAIFASTKQMIDAYKDTTDRCIGFNPTEEKSDIKVIDGINIEAFYLPHGSDSRIINIGFLISVDGVTIFQTGDVDFDQFTFEKFRAFNLPEKKIDLLFIQHYYLRGDSLSDKFIKEAISAKYILPIHYHFTTPPFDEKIISQNYPDAILFNNELESWQMPVNIGTFPVLKGEYLGEILPEDSAIVFAPDLISTDTTIEHGSPTFSLDGKEIYWQSNYRQRGKKTEILLKTMQEVDGVWTSAENSPFGGMLAFSNNGETAFFIAIDSENDKELYSASKKNDEWTNPVSLNLLSRFPELKFLFGPSVSKNGTLYFFAYTEDLETMNNFGIYRSELENGVYMKPELLPASINLEKGTLNWTPFIAPDESYLLFSSNRRNPEKDGGDIYVCFRNSDGSWTESYILNNQVNSNRQERFPYVSPDGKYLFFTRWVERGNEDIFWISSNVIEQMRTKAK